MSGEHNLRLSHLMHRTVQSSDGKTLGHINDLIVDPQSGRIDFAILSLSPAGSTSETGTAGRSSAVGTQTTTGKLIPVPWQLFSQSWSQTSHGYSTSSATSNTATSGMGMHPLTLNVDESKLQSAPSFDASNWSEIQNGSLDQRVYSYFGVNRASGLGTSGSSLQGQGSSGSSNPNK
jgi:sporulation protein YlmC with PRC-barrel domain